ncbi:MAG: adenylate/guanylate cyclase domain-containing protein, partial [Rhodothermales bacterium]|nr:adenylate/guanylate cyclase domain-containing protein [Rhodothermales bacterium]
MADAPAVRKRKRDTIWAELATSLLIGLAVAALTVAGLGGGLLGELELLTLDYRFAEREEARAAAATERRDVYADGDVVIVEIGDEDVQALPGGFPFPRSYYAHFVENLRAAGARAVVFDLTFATEGEGDDAFREALRAADDVVLGAKARDTDALGRFDVIRLDEDYGLVFFDDNPAVGITNVLKDRDDVVRRYTPMWLVSDRLTPTLAVAALGRAEGLPPLAVPEIRDDAFQLAGWTIPKYDPRTFLLDWYGPVGTFRYVPFSHVIDDAGFETADEEAYGVALDLFDERTQALFQDKIVLVGSTMAEERDYHSVPMENPEDPDRSQAMHGVEIHATAIQNVLDGNHLHRVPPGWEALLVVLLTTGVFIGTRRLRRSKTARTRWLEAALLGLVVLAVFGWLEAATELFIRSGLVVSVVPPVLAVALAYTGAAVYSYLAEREQKAFIKRAFGQYLSPTVVEELAEHPERVQLGGEGREMTVLFSDIAGFTSISEALTPEALVTLLNDYLDEMTHVIFEHGGTLDKYIGDAIMAFWNAPLAQEDHALRACRAALGMAARLDALRPTWEADGRPAVYARIGVATGRMVVGNFGSAERFDYTVMGDTVNLASRLEGANKLYGTTIMIAESTYEAVKDH